jgi:hypothetical protein
MTTTNPKQSRVEDEVEQRRRLNRWRERRYRPTAGAGGLGGKMPRQRGGHRPTKVFAFGLCLDADGDGLIN